MWRLYHKLFGWDYVSFEFAGDDSICRILKAPNGVLMVRHSYKSGLQITKNSSKIFTPLTLSQEDFDKLVEV